MQNAAERRAVGVYARCRALQRGTAEGVADDERRYFLRAWSSSAFFRLMFHC